MSEQHAQSLRRGSGDSVGLLQAATELNFAPKMLGGAMVGLLLHQTRGS